ncbi:MAG: toprim domain-containing protein [Candidatus Carsonella ruddii]
MNFICPFHNDNNASFSFKKKFFFCYGCNLKGKLVYNFSIKNFNFFFNKKIIFKSIKKLYFDKNFWLNYLFIRKININISLKFNLGTLKFIYKNNTILSNKLIFPILNINNILIGIGLKTTNIKNKYINLFKSNIIKNEFFFGINIIKNKKYVIIVEGYFDLLTIYKNSYLNIIASLGCNINLNKIIFLLKNFKKIYFCLDGDEAGYKNIEKIKNYKKIYKNDIIFKNMPNGYDPDSYINFFGIKSFLKFLSI